MNEATRSIAGLTASLAGIVEEKQKRGTRTMTIWIVTTGSSDVELMNPKADAYWEDLYDRVRRETDLQQCDRFPAVEWDEKAEAIDVPSRVLGLVYGEHVREKYPEDLKFPLLDVLVPKLKQELAPQGDLDPPSLLVVVLLTDQRKLFQDHMNDEDCPFWQDTCTLKPIFRWYFKEHLGLNPKFLTITPKGQCGIDHWNAMLIQVKRKLLKALKIKCDRDREVVYVSHQAGTPAISSAIQFATISQFKTVKFLVSNQFYRDCNYIEAEPEVISSSTYWRELQIERAKRLIEKGEPGAALEILQDTPNIDPTVKNKLERMVSRFNVRVVEPNGVETSEFEPQAAAKRIVDTLDLVEILFENEKYALGITLLAAAQETFLKAAIIYLVSQLPEKQLPNCQDVLKPEYFVNWQNQGLSLRSQCDLYRNFPVCKSFPDLDLTQFLQFAVPEELDKDKDEVGSSADYSLFWGNQHRQYLHPRRQNDRFCIQNIHRKNNFSPNNSRLLKWLRKVCRFQQCEFEMWNLLDWICTYKREYEDDKRNQLMHNLRGVTKADVIRYLQGNPDKAKLPPSDPAFNASVSATYLDCVKRPFFQALQKVGLCDRGNGFENNLKQELHQLAKQLG